jgi:5'-deoxynucleotidase YfbR-like HD superfamily hydrolase
VSRVDEVRMYWGVAGKLPSVGTVTGKLFSFLDPDPDEICLEDIAHGLSNLCRFNGQTRAYYSVAQHSVIVSQWCNRADALWGLLHDAAEAYLGDVVSPIKRNLGMEKYRLAEEVVMRAIADRYGLPWEDHSDAEDKSGPEPMSVKLADRLAVYLELRDIMNTDAMKYGYRVDRPDLEVLGITIEPLLPPDAKTLFLNRAAELGVFS